ncbi:FYVE zinc finger domain-containing protein [Phytophthora infestans]|nr:FYVE zinc finger domain-containing protein [Phytophthora infestans]
MSAAQDGWTTSPTATSWGVSSSAKLVSKPSRQTANQSATNFEETLRPFDQTSGAFPQTKKPLERTKRPPQQPPQPSQQHSRPIQQDTRPSQRRGSRRHEPVSQRQPRSTQQTPEAPRRHSQHEIRPPRQNPERREAFGHFLDPQLALNQRQDGRQPRRQSDRPLRPSRPVGTDSGGTEASQPRRQVLAGRERSMQPGSGSPVQPPRSSQKISRHHSDKSASSGSSSSTDTYIELSPIRRREIINRMTESVQYVMASMLSDNSSSVQWKPKLRKKDISYFMDESSVKPGQTRFCCVSHSHATVDEIMKLFVVPDADSVVRNNRVLSDSLLEARVLSVLRRPTEKRPMNSMYVRYSSYQAPGLMVNREVCLAVATDIIHQADGSTIGYCLWDSIDDPEFAEASNKPGLEPSTMFRSGFFLRRSGRRSSSNNEQNYTKIVYMVGLEPGGWAPGLTARLLMERFGDNLVRLCSHFRRKNLDSRTFVMKTQWLSKLSAKSCKECHKAFQVLSNRVNCHSCGHVVCRSCVSKEQVDLHAVGLVPMHICFMCLGKAGLPVPPALQKTRSNQGRRRLQSDTATISQLTTQAQPSSQSQEPYQQSKSVVESDLIEEEEEDDDDTDTGEWAFTPLGVPIRPYRMK